MSGARKLSSLDASFLYCETPEMPMHVGSIAIFRLPERYEGNDFEDFKAMIAPRLQQAPQVAKLPDMLPGEMTALEAAHASQRDASRAAAN